MAIRAIAKWSVAVVAVKLSVHIVHVIHVRPRHRRLCQAENGICTVKVLASRRMNWKLYVHTAIARAAQVPGFRIDGVLHRDQVPRPATISKVQAGPLSSPHLPSVSPLEGVPCEREFHMAQFILKKLVNVV